MQQLLLEAPWVRVLRVSEGCCGPRVAGRGEDGSLPACVVPTDLASQLGWLHRSCSRSCSAGRVLLEPRCPFCGKEKMEIS